MSSTSCPRPLVLDLLIGSCPELVPSFIRPYLPPSWKIAHPLWNDFDFYLQAFCQGHALLGLREARVLEQRSSKLLLRTWGKVINIFPTLTIQFYLPSAHHCPDKELRSILQKWTVHRHMPVSVRPLQSDNRPGYEGKFIYVKEVNKTNGRVEQTSRAYAPGDELTKSDSDFWTNHSLDVPSINRLEESSAETLLAGQVGTITLEAEAAVEFIRFIKDGIMCPVEIRPVFNRKTRQELVDEVSHKKITDIIERDPKPPPSQPRLRGEQKWRGALPLEKSTKNAIIGAYLGLPLPEGVNPSQVPENPPEVIIKNPPGPNVKLTHSQSQWVSAIHQMKPGTNDPVVKTGVLQGPPGTGKTQLAAHDILGSVLRTANHDGYVNFIGTRPDGTTYQEQDAGLFLAPTLQACYNLVHCLTPHFQASLHSRQEKLTTGQATLWSLPSIRIVFMSPTRYGGASVEDPFVHIYSMQYYMYEDPTVHEPIDTKRKEVVAYWEDYKQLQLKSLQPDLYPSDQACVDKERADMNGLIRKAERELFDLVLSEGKFNIIVMTTKQAQSFDRQRHPDLNISFAAVDEAAYAVDSHSFAAIKMLGRHPKQVNYYGDRVQLRAPVISRSPCGRLYQSDVMTRLQKPGHILDEAIKLVTQYSSEDNLKVPIFSIPRQSLVHQLNEQHRCPEPLGSITSDLFYNGTVHSALSDAEQMERGYRSYKFPWGIEGFSFAYLGVRGPESADASNSKINHTMNLQVLSLLNIMTNLVNSHTPNKVMVLTPYAGTQMLLEDQIAETWPDPNNRPKCQTVDKSQGREYECVIVVTVRCASDEIINKIHNKYRLPGSVDPEYPDLDYDAISLWLKIIIAGFLNDWPRLNVMTSRECTDLIILGCPKTNSLIEPLDKILKFAMHNNCYFPNGVNTIHRIIQYSHDLWYSAEYKLRTVEEMRMTAIGSNRPVSLLPIIEANHNSRKFTPPPVATIRELVTHPQKRLIRMNEDVIPISAIYPNNSKVAMMTPYVVYDPEAKIDFEGGEWDDVIESRLDAEVTEVMGAVKQQEIARGVPQVEDEMEEDADLKILTSPEELARMFDQLGGIPIIPVPFEIKEEIIDTEYEDQQPGGPKLSTAETKAERQQQNKERWAQVKQTLAARTPGTSILKAQTTRVGTSAGITKSSISDTDEAYSPSQQTPLYSMVPTEEKTTRFSKAQSKGYDCFQVDWSKLSAQEIVGLKLPALFQEFVNEKPDILADMQLDHIRDVRSRTRYALTQSLVYPQRRIKELETKCMTEDREEAQKYWSYKWKSKLLSWALQSTNR